MLCEGRSPCGHPCRTGPVWAGLGEDPGLHRQAQTSGRGERHSSLRGPSSLRVRLESSHPGGLEDGGQEGRQEEAQRPHSPGRAVTSCGCQPHFSEANGAWPHLPRRRLCQVPGLALSQSACLPLLMPREESGHLQRSRITRTFRGPPGGNPLVTSEKQSSSQRPIPA